jgi:hypothetical protein
LASVVPLAACDGVGVFVGVKVGLKLIVGVFVGVLVKVGVILGVKLIVGVGVLVGVELIVGVILGVKVIVGVIDGVGVGVTSEGGSLYTFITAAHTCLGCLEPFGYIISLMFGCLLNGFGGIFDKYNRL